MTVSGMRWLPLSRRTSRANSRAGSRAASPERGHREGENITGALGDSSVAAPVSPSPSTTAVHPVVAPADETIVHAHNPSSRQEHGLFSVMMKPLTGLSAQFGHSHAHALALRETFPYQGLHPHLHSSASHGGAGVPSAEGASLHAHHSQQSQHAQHPHHSMHHRGSTSSTSSSGSSGPDGSSPSLGDANGHAQPTLNGSSSSYAGSSAEAAAQLLQRALTSVPDYMTATRTRGVPPLESLRALPTYEDSEAQVHAAQAQAQRVTVGEVH